VGATKGVNWLLADTKIAQVGDLTAQKPQAQQNIVAIFKLRGASSM